MEKYALAELPPNNDRVQVKTAVGALRAQRPLPRLTKTVFEMLKVLFRVSHQGETSSKIQPHLRGLDVQHMPER